MTDRAALLEVPAFNTTADEKINANSDICGSLPAISAFVVVNLGVRSAESNAPSRPLRRSGWLVACKLGFLILGGLAPATAQPAAVPTHGIAMHGAPALPAGFANMPYVNPGAPKGGRIVFGLLGTFDSLNPFIVKGIAVQQVRGYVTESRLRCTACSLKASRPTRPEAT